MMEAISGRHRGLATYICKKLGIEEEKRISQQHPKPDLDPLAQIFPRLNHPSHLILTLPAVIDAHLSH